MFDISAINPALVGAPLALSAAALGAFGWNREMRRRKAKKADNDLMEAAIAAVPPNGSVGICTRGAPNDMADNSGRIMLILVGTFSENLGENLLTLLWRNGMEGAIGSVLLIEFDSSRREDFLHTVPPVFTNRIITVSFSGLPGGLGNESPQQVREYIDRWGPSLIKGCQRVVEIHQRLHNGEEPATCLLFLSLGGTAITGVTAVETIKPLCPLTKFYGVTAIPVDDLLRERVEYILEEHLKAGVKGFVIADNLGNEVANDFGAVGTVAGFVSAARNSDMTVEMNNAFYLMFEKAPGGLVRYSTYVRMVPGYPYTPTHPLVPRRYYVPRSAIFSAIMTGLTEVRHPERDSLLGVDMTGHAPLTSEFDIVLTAVAPHDLKEDEDDVLLAQYLKRKDRRNHHLLFSSVATVIDDPAKASCPVAIIWLRALQDGPTTLRQVTAPVESPKLTEGSKGSTDQKFTLERSISDADASPV